MINLERVRESFAVAEVSYYALELYEWDLVAPLDPAIEHGGDTLKWTQVEHSSSL